jgi:hypothetical protein
MANTWLKGHRCQRLTFDTFLSHLDDWPPCHIFLAVREEEGDALRAVRNLAQAYPTAEVHRLEEMNLSDSGEAARLITFLRDRVPASPGVDDQNRRDDRGLSGDDSSLDDREPEPSNETVEDLAQAARDARGYRFRELEDLLKGLKGQMYDSGQEGDLARRYQLLDELRLLAEQLPDDSTVRERLAKGLVKRLIDPMGDEGFVRERILSRGVWRSVSPMTWRCKRHDLDLIHIP